MSSRDRNSDAEPPVSSETPVELGSAREIQWLTLAHAADVQHIGSGEPLVPGVDVFVGRRDEPARLWAEGDEAISERHARLGWADGGPFIEDLNSRTGTFVNGRRVLRAPLAFQDIVRIGDALLCVTRAPRASAGLDDDASEHGYMIGRSYALRRLRRDIREAAKGLSCGVPILLVGATGTGKELAARALHDASGSRGKITAVNIAGIADSMVQSELFGHVRGAFTSAQRDRRGLVEVAATGTLFIDEIASASPTAQVALLRLLENREFRSVGSDDFRRARAQFVAACQPGLEAKVQAGEFREDLRYRIGGWTVPVPLLSQRPEDIPLLARHLANEEVKGEVDEGGKGPLVLSTDLAFALMRHSWPGNVRELRQMMTRLALTPGGHRVLHLTEWLRDALAREGDRRIPEPHSPAVRPQRRRRPKTPRPQPSALVTLLRKHGGLVSAAARELGVERPTLYRWARALGIDLDAVRGEFGRQSAQEPEDGPSTEPSEPRPSPDPPEPGVAGTTPEPSGEAERGREPAPTRPLAREGCRGDLVATDPPARRGVKGGPGTEQEIGAGMCQGMRDRPEGGGAASRNG